MMVNWAGKTASAPQCFCVAALYLAASLASITAAPVAGDQAPKRGTLVRAVYDGNLARVQAMVQRNPRLVDQQDANQTSALTLAALRKRTDIGLFLIKNRASVDARDRKGYSALMYAVRLGNVDLTKALVAAKANVSFRGSDGKTAADLAKTEELRRLLALPLTPP